MLSDPYGRQKTDMLKNCETNRAPTRISSETNYLGDYLFVSNISLSLPLGLEIDQSQTDFAL